MNVLELEPLKKQKLELVLVETEFPVTWTIDKPTKEDLDDWNLRLISQAYIKVIDKLADKHAPKFALEELGNRTHDEFTYDNPLVDVFKKRGIAHGWVDIDENALGYLASTLDPAREMQRALDAEATRIKATGDKTKRDLLQEVMLRAEYLAAEVDAEIRNIKYSIRQAWMMMGVLDKARAIGAPALTGMLLCDAGHFEGLASLAGQLGIECVKINIDKKVKQVEGAEKLAGFLQGSVLEVSPVKVKAKSEAEKILYMFDTDDFASPFDINMAYDAGFNVVVPFSKVTADTVTRLVQDAMFSRKATAPTCFFVGGSNVALADKIAAKVIKALVPPFEHPVVIDPRGSHTTASAVVAKTVEMANKHGWDDIGGKKVAIFGAGPVGQIAAIIAAKEGCNATLVETWNGATEESIKALVKTLNDEAGEGARPIMPAYAVDLDARQDLAREADIIWSVAVAGVQILSKDAMSAIAGSGTKLVIDINAVPPSGIEGLKAKHEDTEIYPGVFGTGSLALGGLKYVAESNMLKEAANTKGLKIINYNVAYETCKTILFGKKVAVVQK